MAETTRYYASEIVESSDFAEAACADTRKAIVDLSRFIKNQKSISPIELVELEDILVRLRTSHSKVQAHVESIKRDAQRIETNEGGRHDFQ